MAAVHDGKHLVLVVSITLMFLVSAVLVAYLTSSDIGVLAVMAGMPMTYVAAGLIRARVQHGDDVLELEQPRGPGPQARDHARTGRSSRRKE